MKRPREEDDRPIHAPPPTPEPRPFKPKAERVLIFGATGFIGKYVTIAITRAKERLELKRLAIFTSKETILKERSFIQSLFDHGVDIIWGDIFDDRSIRGAYNSKDGFDTIISCLGRDVLDRQIRMARLANDSSSVVRFFPSEFAADVDHLPFSTGTPPQQTKLSVRRYLKSSCPRLEYTILTCGAIAELFTAPNPYEYCGTIDVKARRTINFGNQDKQISFCTLPDIGNFMVACLARFMYTGYRQLFVESFVTTQTEITDEYRRQCNAINGAWFMINLDMGDYINHERKACIDRHPVSSVFAIRRTWYKNGTCHPRPDNDLLGFRGRDSTSTLETLVRDQIRLARNMPY